MMMMMEEENESGWKILETSDSPPPNTLLSQTRDYVKVTARPTIREAEVTPDT